MPILSAPHRSSAGLAAGLLLTLAGCAVGPDFQPPAAPTADHYEFSATPAATPSAATAFGESQTLHVNADLPGEWWTLYHSPTLDKLIRDALDANPDIKAANAALRQAQELAAVNRGVWFPQIDGSLQRERVKFTGAEQGIPSLSSLYNLTSASLSVSYNADVFGGTRRTIEAGDQQAAYQRWERQAAILTLTANVVTAALQEASLKAQIAATETIIDAESRQLDKIETQFRLGGAARTDVLSQQSLLAQSRATLPALQGQLDQQRHLLATYAGHAPSDAVDVDFDLGSLTLPTELPVTLPARLVEQRPDIQAASANLHYASAEVGVAEANRWPQLTLSASYGTDANQIGNLFSPASIAWSLVGGVTQPIFHGGEFAHRKAAAVAAYDQYLAQYESTVLTALRNVADSLRALQTDAEALQQQLAFQQAAQRSLALSKERYATGAISSIVLLDAERAEAQARIALIQAQVARLSDTAALFQALGGGWWNRPDDAPTPPDLLTPLF